jgi:hypothetical protein
VVIVKYCYIQSHYITEANVEIKSVSVENQLVNTDIFIIAVYHSLYLTQNILQFWLKNVKIQRFKHKNCAFFQSQIKFEPSKHLRMLLDGSFCYYGQVTNTIIFRLFYYGIYLGITKPIYQIVLG